MTDVIRGGAPATRAFTSSMEIRGSDGRTVFGVAVPFDQPTQVRDMGGPYTEVFRHGAFTRTIAERGPSKVKVLGLHDMRLMPLGRAESLEEQSGMGLMAGLYISKTRAGDEALELVRDGALDSMSVGFVPVTSKTAKDGTVERHEVKLHEISLVPFPAYDGAKIAGIRSADIEQMLRASSLSPADHASLSHVLSLIAAADNAVDEAQPLLAEVLGVPNPDEDDDKPRAAAAFEWLHRKHLADLQRLRFTA